MERRQFIVGTTSVATLGLAGCVGGLGSGPEDAAEEFFVAAAAGDIEAQEQFLHEASTIEPTDQEVEMTTLEVESLSVEAFAAETGSSASEAEIEQRTARLDEQMDELGADEYAYVSYSFETEEYGSDDGHVLLVNDGEWLIYQLAGGPSSSQESAAKVSAPETTVEYYFESEYEVTITHGGGDSINASNLSIEVGGTAVLSDSANWDVSDGWDGTVQTGDEITVTDRSQTDHSGDDVQIWWNNPNGGSANVITQRSWP